ncbi:hypothetical protein PTTG_01113 [Puccinia triticina 1-1 BBBD Race 1]|uniref:Uncharacterized protein n=1 Tax=Puccinia triticina (isolate 1-1 / race 1 (BBBD)) TaxID=630390 RepID=A0A0C4EK40_PUCT1|nr:hypothetical protein PTTG_01113 [Puccinia triticina 1-1 BBBD Race 1]
MSCFHSPGLTSLAYKDSQKPSHDSSANAQHNLAAAASSSSSSLGLLSPQSAPRINLDQVQTHLAIVSASPSILTAPIPSTDPFSSRDGLPNVPQGHHLDHLLFQSPGSTDSHYALPTIPHYPAQLGTASIASTSSPRVHTSTAISQSAPSLPEALLKFKRDSRFHHPRTSAMNQNGKLTHQAGGTSNSSPIRHLSNALFRDPNKIPHGLLDQALKSQLMRSQLDLITSLQDVPTRLVVVKKARLSALRAELTVLNHSLPKGCCLGMYCNRDHCDGVLKDHLDFDPNRRSNYEDLRKAIKGSAISANKATNSKTPNPNIYLINDSSPSFSESNVNKLATAEQPSCRSSTNQHTIKSLGMAKISSLLPPVGESFNHLGLASIISPTALSFDFPEEEIDLVEQIYGKSKAGLDSHQTINDDGEEEEEDSFLYNHRHSEPLNLPAGLHNKALNKQAWKRAEPVVALTETLNNLHSNELTPHSTY